MFSPDQYQLLDFGRGRKLERFGQFVIDRPAPAAEGLEIRDEERWQKADARYERTSPTKGRWRCRTPMPEIWWIAHGDFGFHLKLTDFGHLGVFAEQAENWDWVTARIAGTNRPIKVLNLFAYTGGSTLAAAAAGADVVHIDASKTTVEMARANAETAALSQQPIRWLIDDAAKFVKRELRRDSRYDAVILDPPSYGHGPRGEAWKLSTDLAPLLAGCAELVANEPAFFLLTCHTPGFGPAELEAMVSDTLFGRCQQGVQAKSLSLTASDGRRLPCGTVARWPK